MSREEEVKLVKQLRKETGAGTMDCQKALREVDYDWDKAKELLRRMPLVPRKGR